MDGYWKLRISSFVMLAQKTRKWGSGGGDKLSPELKEAWNNSFKGRSEILHTQKWCSSYMTRGVFHSLSHLEILEQKCALYNKSILTVRVSVWVWTSYSNQVCWLPCRGDYFQCSSWEWKKLIELRKASAPPSFGARANLALRSSPVLPGPGGPSVHAPITPAKQTAMELMGAISIERHKLQAACVWLTLWQYVNHPKRISYKLLFEKWMKLLSLSTWVISTSLLAFVSSIAIQGRIGRKCFFFSFYFSFCFPFLIMTHLRLTAWLNRSAPSPGQIQSQLFSFERFAIGGDFHILLSSNVHRISMLGAAEWPLDRASDGVRCQLVAAVARVQ